MKTQQKAADYHLKPNHIKKLIFSCDNFRDRCIVKTFAYTGMRREEIQKLDVDDVDFDRKRIQIKRGKGKKERTIPVSQSLLSDLKHLVNNRKKGPVFVSQKGGELSTRQINRILAKAGEKAGVKNPNPRLKNINPHLLRHSFGRNALKQGMPMEKVQQILGHSSIATTIDVYGTPSVDDTQDDYDQKIEGLYG